MIKQCQEINYLNNIARASCKGHPCKKCSNTCMMDVAWKKESSSVDQCQAQQRTRFNSASKTVSIVFQI